MARFVIGVDGGGSKTLAVILNEEGKLLASSRSGSSNLHLAGKEGTRQALLAAMQAAADAARVDLSGAAAVTWALAGAGREREARQLRALRDKLFPGIPGGVVTDAEAALVGGVGARYGLVAIAGTGMIVYGVNDQGISARAGGWGHLLDEGSGYAIAHQALRAVAQAADGIDLATRLTPRLLEQVQLKAPADLIPWLYAPERTVAEIAALAPIVLEEAESGDLIATDVIVRAADALAAGVAAVTRRLGFSYETVFPLVLTGGLLLASNFYQEVVSQAVRTRVPVARPQLPRHNAAVGAGLLALTMLGRALPLRSEYLDSSDRAWTSEQSNILSQDLDRRTTLELVGLMHREDRRAVAAVRPNLPAIAAAIDAIAARMEKGGRLIYVGAGTSGRLGILDASECPPTFNTDPEQVVGIIAGGREALTTAVEAAEDNPDDGAQAMIALAVGASDSVVGIAASGRTPYVIGALAEARRCGALTVALTCNLPAPLAQNADFILAPLVGPEVIAGSTRLKAGTTQKLVLNMLSTGVMVRLGKTYGNLMVDVRQQNAKLQERAKRIVAQACHIDESEADEMLARSEGEVKVAIVSLLLGCSPDEAHQRLERVGGRVREAVAAGLKTNKP